MLTRFKDSMRQRETEKRLLEELSPEAMCRLACEVDSLSLCAAMTCPDELSLQCVQKEFHALRSRAIAPNLAEESPQMRLHLRQGLIHSRQLLMEGVQNAARPTRFLQ